jgi:hypothetical protein
MNILDAIKDDRLLRPFLGADLDSWRSWATALRCLYGLPIKADKSKELIWQSTGRDYTELPKEGFRTALFLIGRRSGKSRIAAVIAGFEALFVGHEKKLAAGEVGLVAVVSPTRLQSGIVWNYLRGLFQSSPLLRDQIVDTTESSKTLTLRNGLQVMVITGDPRKVRGFTLVAAVVDETAFFGLDEESSVRSDVELIRSIRPSLATTGGRLICISSPYAKKGFCFSTYLRFHGDNRGKSANFSANWTTLLWKAPSMVMNPTLRQSEIDAAFADDPMAARSEYGGEFRDDVSEYISRAQVESLVVRGRKGLLPRLTRCKYVAFCDLSGGRGDDAALAIAHREGRKVILDCLQVWKAPFNPHQVVGEMSDELKKWDLRRVTGDNYSAEFVASSFAAYHVQYRKSDQPKSVLYRELLPRLCSAEIELLDDTRLITQLAGLERRTRSGGQDKIDHAPGAKDDAVNVVAGVAALLGCPPRRVGAGALLDSVADRGMASFITERKMYV